MLWNRRLARYRRLAAVAEEAATTGWFAAAYARHDRERAEIAARFGSAEAAAESEEGRRQRRAAFLASLSNGEHRNGNRYDWQSSQSPADLCVHLLDEVRGQH